MPVTNRIILSANLSPLGLFNHSLIEEPLYANIKCDDRQLASRTTLAATEDEPLVLQPRSQVFQAQLS